MRGVLALLGMGGCRCPGFVRDVGCPGFVKDITQVQMESHTDCYQMITDSKITCTIVI